MIALQSLKVLNRDWKMEYRREQRRPLDKHSSASFSLDTLL